MSRSLPCIPDGGLYTIWWSRWRMTGVCNRIMSAKLTHMLSQGCRGVLEMKEVRRKE
ncbi:MAG: hypothetical protein HFJ09_06355 [Lachnospiraceae bacterium]|nr:hypothetical protein [Lachnospiraceae bacterium]